MQIPANRLAAFSAAPTPVPPLVEPALSLAAEVALLSPEAPRRVVRHVVRVIRRAHPKVPGEPDGAGTEAARLARVKAIIGRPALPEPRDGELLVALAAVGSLPVSTRAEHLHARARLAAVVQDPPPAVQAIADDLGIEPRALAERLLPARRDPSGHQFGSSIYPSLGGV